MAAGGEKKIIVLDADRVRRDTLRSLLADGGHVTFSFEDEKNCLENLLAIDPDLVVAAALQDQRGDRFVNAVKWAKPELPLLIISDDQPLNRRVKTIGFENIGFLRENNDLSEFQGAIFRLLGDEVPLPEHNGDKFPLIVGRSPAMVRIREMLPALGLSNDPVYVYGEPGTGKELVASAIHLNSKMGWPFVRIAGEAACLQDLPTGEGGPSNPWGALAENDILGKFGGGTLFIDGLESLSLTAQSRLLRLFEETENYGRAEIDGCPSHLRILASSARDLADAMRSGAFRKDLYFRLSVFKIEIPPLRKRPEDIQPLVDFFTDTFCLSLGKTRCELTDATRAAFQTYHWPGNVRELKCMVKRTVVLGAENPIIQMLCRSNGGEDSCSPVGSSGEDFQDMVDMDSTGHGTERFKNFSLKRIAREYTRRAEIQAIQKVLDTTGGNRKKTARLLGVSYKSLLSKIKAYDLS
jgi:DNA-binding NtrC family response regulator